MQNNRLRGIPSLLLFLQIQLLTKVLTKHLEHSYETVTNIAFNNKNLTQSCVINLSDKNYAALGNPLNQNP